MGGGNTEGAVIQQWEKADTASERNQLYKITYLGKDNDGIERYSIRSMTNNELGLYVPNSSHVTLTKIPTSEKYSEFSEAQRWEIQKQGNNLYAFKTYDKKYLSVPGNSLNGSQIITSSSLSTPNLWTLERYTGYINEASFLRFTSTMITDETYDFDGYMVSTAIGHNGPVTWEIKNSTGYYNTDMATINATTGVMTANKPGTVQVRMKNPYLDSIWFGLVNIDRLPNPNAQNKTNWCWVACSKMVGEHNGGSGALNTGASFLDNTNGVHSYKDKIFYGESHDSRITVDAGQVQIVKAVFGNDGNHDGGDNWVNDTEDSLQRASIKTMSVGHKGNTVELTQSEIQFLKDELAAGRWVIGYIYISGSAHDIVIQEYNAIFDKYTFWDPWTDTQTTFSSAQLNTSTIITASGIQGYSLGLIHYCR